ncbi:MAG: universal stress protein [Polyangiaceae bacterium]|nr:universal stress protein [Polyangiaceae bacterium]
MSVTLRDTPAGTSPRTLFVIEGHTRSKVGLSRAVTLARVLDAELEVLCVLPERANPFSPNLRRDELPRSLQNARAARHGVLDWVREVTGTPLPEHRLRIRFGALVDQVAIHAAKLGAGLVVLAPGKGRVGSRVIELARVSGLPVLVARRAGSGAGILAATDLADPDYPVLRQAAELSRRLSTPLVAIHNVNPITTTPSLEMPWPVAGLPGEIATESKRALLGLASESLPVDTEAVLGTDVNPSDAILHEAAVRDVDLVVVGTRPRSWFDRVVMGSVAQVVVNRARRSVLVTPLNRRAPGNSTPIGLA